MNKKIIVIAVGILLVASLGFNLYLGVWKSIEKNLMNKGANAILGQILNQIKNTGQVKIGDTILIPQIQFQAEKPELELPNK